MYELVPIISGILLGSALGYVRHEWRIRIGVLFAILLGAAATLLSGEYLQSWTYLVFDAALVGVSAATSFVLVRRTRWAG